MERYKERVELIKNICKVCDDESLLETYIISGEKIISKLQNIYNAEKESLFSYLEKNSKLNLNFTERQQVLKKY